MRNPAVIRRFCPSTATHPKLPLPVPPQTRIAQVSSPAALFEGTQYFSQIQTAELQQYGPQVLLGSSEDLLALAVQIEKQSLNLQQLDRAVFVLTGHRDLPLREEVRATLWQAFGTPVYELLLDSHGLPLAAECEAHEGWHVQNGVTFSVLEGQLWYRRRRGHLAGTGLTGRVESQPCPCGRTGERLVQIAMDFQDALRHRLTA